MRTWSKWAEYEISPPLTIFGSWKFKYQIHSNKRKPNNVIIIYTCKVSGNSCSSGSLSGVLVPLGKYF